MKPDELAQIKARARHAFEDSLIADCTAPAEVWVLVEQDVPDLVADVEHLERENARLRAALRFYAHADHYLDGAIDHDVGRVARAALEYTQS